MKTQKQLIEYFTSQLNKVIASHGAASGYTTTAFFNLQAAKMGMTEKEIFSWSAQEVERLKEITLSKV